MNSIWKFLTSLRLTVVLLVLAIVLVFVGTVAQADEGLYQAQERYFKHWIVVGASMWGHHVPLVLPGGYTLGVGLLVNLVAAHVKRFKWGWSKVGIHLTHLGIVMLLVGQLATDMLQVESRLSFKEGEAANYLEHHRAHELAVAVDVADGQEEVVVIPEAIFSQGGVINAPKLPFTIKVKEYHPNAEVRQRAPMVDKGEPPATQGAGAKVTMTPLPVAKDMDSKSLPAAVLEISAGGKVLGTWLASPFLNAQTIEAGGKSYRVQLRDERTYLPYGMTLLQATHKKYPGSDTPKDFRSRVRIENPGTHENREVEISMNNPLRYAGLAFFQYQMTKDELDRAPGSSVLQVVRNPSWLVPYIGCIVVALGMLWQFLHHLVGFISKRRTA
jgi:cytochrome c biogenesis protein ResB